MGAGARSVFVGWRSEIVKTRQKKVFLSFLGPGGGPWSGGGRGGGGGKNCKKDGSEVWP